MTVPKPHKDWKLDMLPVPETRAMGPDELLTHLWLRIKFDNQRTTRGQNRRELVAELASQIEGDRAHFVGFEHGSGVAETWLRADLVKVLRKKPHVFTVARPVHLPATKLRNARHDSDANASSIPYLWLARLDPALLTELREWIDVSDESLDELGDLPTYALMRLAEDEEADTPLGESRVGGDDFLCDTRGRWFSEDLRALLAYRRHLPRAVMLDHIKRLTTLHIGLHLLQTFAGVVQILGDPDADCGCAGGGPCSWMPQLVADCGEDQRSAVAKLAERSWTAQEQSIASYVRSHLTLKRLSEFAESSFHKRSADRTTVRGLARVRANATTKNLQDWSRSRIDHLVDHDSDFGTLRDEYQQMGLTAFDVYMGLLFSDGERRWFKYHRDVLDYIFGKNDRQGVMRQPLGGRRMRRMALSAPMLETLVLVSMVRSEGDVAVTRSLRVDELTDRLANRYGLAVATPPPSLQEDAAATRTMIDNHQLLRSRLRQAGLFVDQSDAFLTQTIRPRVRL